MVLFLGLVIISCRHSWCWGCAEERQVQSNIFVLNNYSTHLTSTWLACTRSITNTCRKWLCTCFIIIFSRSSSNFVAIDKMFHPCRVIIDNFFQYVSIHLIHVRSISHYRALNWTEAEPHHVSCRYWQNDWHCCTIIHKHEAHNHLSLTITKSGAAAARNPIIKYNEQIITIKTRVHCPAHYRWIYTHCLGLLCNHCVSPSTLQQNLLPEKYIFSPVFNKPNQTK